MNLQIVNADPRYSTAKLIEPTTLGYIHVAAEVDPCSMPFLPNRREKSKLLSRLKELAHQLERLDVVEKVTVYDAIVIAPPRSRPWASPPTSTSPRSGIFQPPPNPPIDIRSDSSS